MSSIDGSIPPTKTPRQLSLFEPVEIPLTKGCVALVDPIDADFSSLRWYSSISGSGIYAARREGKPKRTIYLHRAIMERAIGRPLEKTEEVDHINGDKLNNRRSNLRVASRRQNSYNTPRQRNNTSGFKGVYWSQVGNYWCAQIKVNQRCEYLGHFDTPEEAHDAYCKAAEQHAGEFARLS